MSVAGEEPKKTDILFLSLVFFFLIFFSENNKTKGAGLQINTLFSFMNKLCFYL